MGIFDLPGGWIYVVYENGTEENVANQDSLSKGEAEWFKKEWESKGKINKIELRKNNKVVKEYNFN